MRQVIFVVMALFAVASCAAQDPIRKPRADGKVYEAKIKTPSQGEVAFSASTLMDCMNARSNRLLDEPGSVLISGCKPVDPVR